MERKQLRKTVFTLILLCLLSSTFISVLNFGSVPVVKAEPETRIFGNNVLPIPKNVTVTIAGDGKSFVVDTTNNLTWSFSVGANKYNQIYEDGVQIVKDEMWLLYNEEKNNDPHSVSTVFEQFSAARVNVTQLYTSSTGDYNITWSLFGNANVKISLNANLTVSGNCTIEWRTYVYKDYFEVGDQFVKFWDTNEVPIVFNYEDVYNVFGDVTTVEGVEAWTKGKRADFVFDVGFLEVGEFILDPTFGNTVEEVQTVNWPAWWAFQYNVPEAGTITSISVFCPDYTPSIHVGIYTDSEDYPVALLVETGEWTLTATGWQLKNVVNTPFSAGKIWIAIGATGTGVMGHLNVQDQALAGITATGTFGDCPETFPGGGSSHGHDISIYVTYTTEEEGSYVTAEGGHLSKDGEPIYFYGTNVYARNPPNGYQTCSYEMLRYLPKMGINFARLWSYDWMPTYNIIDPTYNATFANFVGNLTEMKIYFVISVTNFYLADWFDYPNTMYNETVTVAYENIFGNLSQWLDNNEYFVGFILPWNEWGFPYYSKSQTMTGNDWATGNLTCMWNFYLENKYGTIENLNSTWSVNSQTWLNASEGEDHFLTSWGDSQSGGIKFPYSYQVGASASDFRKADWGRFQVGWQINYTKRLSDRIEANNDHALKFWSCGSQGSGGVGKFIYESDFPDFMDGWEPHPYFAGADTDDERYDQLFTRIPVHLASYLYYPKPMISGECSACAAGGGTFNAGEWAVIDHEASQMYWYGIDAVAWFAWLAGGGGHYMLTLPDAPEIDSMHGWYMTPRYAEAYKAGVIEPEPQVLLIGELSTHSFAAFLRSFGLQFAQVGCDVGGIEPEMLNNFDLIIIQVAKYTSKQTLIKVREWAEAGNGTVVIIPVPSMLDEYGKAFTLNDIGYDSWILQNWFGDTPYSWDPPCPTNVTVKSSFGDLTAGEMFVVNDEGGGSARCITTAKLATGVEALLNYTDPADSNEAFYLARNSTGNVYIFGEGFPSVPKYPTDTGFMKIWKALLNETGLLKQDSPYTTLEIDNTDKGYAWVHEHNMTWGQSDTRTVNFTAGIEIGQDYVIYELNPHDNQTRQFPCPDYVATVSGATLRTGWTCSTKSYQTRLFRIVNASQPHFIMIENGSLTSETWFSANDTLRTSLWGETGHTAKLYVYWQTMSSDVKIKFSNATVVNAEDYYNSTSKLITVPFIYESEEIISVYDLGGAPPNIYLTVTNPQNTTYSSSSIPVELSASGGTIDKIWFNCWNGSWIYAENQTYTTQTNMQNFVNGTTYQFYGWANNTDAEEDEETVWFTVSISPLNPEAYQYSIDFLNQKVYVQLRYEGTEDPVPTANCSYIGTLELTNSTGWAEFSLSSLSDFSYNTTAYPPDYPDNNISVALAKKTFIIQSATNVTHTLTNLQYEGYKFYWSATGNGATSFKIYSIDNPYYLKINGVTKLEGDSWSKSGNIITVNDILGSTHDYILSFSAPYNPPTPSPSDGWEEELDDFVDEVYASGASFVEQYLWLIVAAIVCMFIGTGIIIKLWQDSK